MFENKLGSTATYYQALILGAYLITTRYTFNQRTTYGPVNRDL